MHEYRASAARHTIGIYASQFIKEGASVIVRYTLKRCQRAPIVGQVQGEHRAAYVDDDWNLRHFTKEGASVIVSQKCCNG